MIETATQWVREKYRAIRNAASSRGTVTPDPVDAASEARRKFADAVGSFSSLFRSSVDSLEENTYLREFLVIGESFRRSGYIAGHWGIREHGIEGIASMRVLITKNLIEEKFLSNQRKLDSQVKILQMIGADATRDYRTKNRYYERLNRAYQYSHRQFSLVLGVIYGFFSITLILADIPLALELTKEGLNLKSDKASMIQDLFEYGTAEGFLPHFFRVLTANWEVVLFATGIAFCTIYIKIFYDDFVGAPLENLIKKASESPADYEEFDETAGLSDMERNEEPGTEKIGFEDHDTRQSETAHASIEPAKGHARQSLKEAIRGRFTRLWWWRFGVKLGVLLVLFLTILVLGYFRYSVTSNSDEAVGAVPPLVILLTYALLTLIFPIVSGICGSLSLSCFQNWREMNKAGKEKSRAQIKVLDATEKFTIKQEEKEKNKSFLEWLKKEETIEQLKNFLLYCYNSGYKFGYSSPEWAFGGDLFKRAEALRNRNLIDPDRLMNAEVPPAAKVGVIEASLN